MMLSQPTTASLPVGDPENPRPSRADRADPVYDALHLPGRYSVGSRQCRCPAIGWSPIACSKYSAIPKVLSINVFSTHFCPRKCTRGPGVSSHTPRKESGKRSANCQYAVVHASKDSKMPRTSSLAVTVQSTHDCVAIAPRKATVKAMYRKNTSLTLLPKSTLGVDRMWQSEE